MITFLESVGCSKAISYLLRSAMFEGNKFFQEALLLYSYLESSRQSLIKTLFAAQHISLIIGYRAHGVLQERQMRSVHAPIAGNDAHAGGVVSLIARIFTFGDVDVLIAAA
uniref:Uncharacterized protein n=1 Tax=Romanomermis culicivorax TaxID=13658 RepID=A0A915JSQ2_ROMCU